MLLLVVDGGWGIMLMWESVSLAGRLCRMMLGESVVRSCRPSRT